MGTPPSAAPFPLKWEELFNLKIRLTYNLQNTVYKKINIPEKPEQPLR